MVMRAAQTLVFAACLTLITNLTKLSNKNKGLVSSVSSYPDGDLDEFEDLDNGSNYND